MKNIVRVLLLTVGIIVAAIALSQAQSKVDEERMQRDIEVAENVLSTLIKQELGRRNFFPMEVEGTYMAGYGVTFRLPMDFGGTMWKVMAGDGSADVVMNLNGSSNNATGYGYSNSSGSNESTSENGNEPVKVKVKTRPAARVGVSTTVRGRQENNDSMRTAYNAKLVSASKNFIADYGDLISQLTPSERITVTNRMDGSRNWLWKSESGHVYLSLEATKADISQYKQGKMTRDQLLAKIKVVNTETSEDLSPDLELLSSIFDRLYRPDLSKTFFTQEGLYYERMKDYGVMYYMNVYSSTDADYRRWNMPTVGLTDIDQVERDKKVKELYPLFEKNIKEDILEYGKTLKSLKDDEVLVFNIKLTKCKDCGIPSTLEVSIKSSVLKDYSTGKLTREAAVEKESVKKGAVQ